MVNVLVHIQPHNLNKFGLLELDGEFYSDFPLSFPTAHDWLTKITPLWFKKAENRFAFSHQL